MAVYLVLSARRCICTSSWDATKESLLLHSVLKCTPRIVGICPFINMAVSRAAFTSGSLNARDWFRNDVHIQSIHLTNIPNPGHQTTGVRFSVSVRIRSNIIVLSLGYVYLQNHDEEAQSQETGSHMSVRIAKDVIKSDL